MKYFSFHRLLKTRAEKIYAFQLTDIKIFLEIQPEFSRLLRFISSAKILGCDWSKSGINVSDWLICSEEKKRIKQENSGGSFISLINPRQFPTLQLIFEKLHHFMSKTAV